MSSNAAELIDALIADAFAVLSHDHGPDEEPHGPQMAAALRRRFEATLGIPVIEVDQLGRRIHGKPVAVPPGTAVGAFRKIRGRR